jgi:hypothetical protein
MIKYVRFEPKQSLIHLPLEAATLRGYRRLSLGPPSAVLPVFKDPNGDVDSLFLYQRVTNDAKVVEFIGDPDLRHEHVIPVPIDKQIGKCVGEMAVYAYELDSDQVLFAERSHLRDLLREILHKSMLVSFPFAGLEISRFVGDPDAEAEYAARCGRDLAKRSYKLAKSWAAKAHLSDKARIAAVKASEIARPEDEQWRRVFARLRRTGMYKSVIQHIAFDRIEYGVARHVIAPGFRMTSVPEELENTILSLWREENRKVHRVAISSSPLTRHLEGVGLTRDVAINDIQRVVSARYKISRAAMLSARRTASIVRPRQIAMYLARTLTRRSLSEIGRYFGERDHTTVLHAIRRIEDFAGVDQVLAKELRNLAQSLKKGS